MLRLPVMMGFVWFAAAALAQNDRGSITGIVTDQTTAVVAKAAVMARNSATGTLYQTLTTATGNYTLASLAAGSYVLNVEVTGFKKYAQRGITVQVAQASRVDVSLEPGSDSVTVDSDASLLRSEGADQSTNVTAGRMNALPLNFGASFGSTNTEGNVRNPLIFAALAPGVAPLSGSSTQIRVGGAPNTTFRVMLDGHDSTSSIDPSHASELQPSIDALQEVTLETSNFAAEYGQVAGGLFNFTSKSGSSQLHGGAYEYFTNEALNAGQPLTDNGKGGLVRPRDRRNDFGVNLGGPVVIPKILDGRETTFFFVNFEMFRNQAVNAGSSASVPTVKMRNGDFSEILTGRTLATDPLGRPILENTIYDPLTSRPVAGALVRDPFQGNLIPQDRLDPVARRIQALIPAPSNNGLVNNFAEVYENDRTQDIPSVKVDHSYSIQSKVSFYWSRYRSDMQSGPDGLPSPITGVRIRYLRSQTARINYDQALTPTLLVHLGVGYLRYHDPDFALKSVLDYDAVAGLGLTGGASLGFPRITGLGSSYGGMSLGMGPGHASDYYNDKPTTVISATLVRRNHTFRGGGEWHIDKWTDRSSTGSQGIFSFSALQTTLPSTQGQSLGGGSIGFPYASFLLGLASDASVNSVQDPQLRKTVWGIFAQDTWRVSRRLTLDYGGRWDYQEAPREMHQRTAMFGPTVPNPSAGGLLGATIYDGIGPGRCNCSFTTPYPYAIGPRLGAAYQIDRQTVLRAGWGVTYGGTTNINHITDARIIGVGWNQLQFSTSIYGDAALVLKNGLQYDPAQLTSASLDPGIRPSPGQINAPPYYLDRNGGRPSRINQWSVGLQREITRDLLVEAAYVGNRGVWFQANDLLDLNALTPERIRAAGLDINNAADRALLVSPLNSPTAQARGFAAPYPAFPAGLTVAQSLRPFPQFGTIPVRWAPLGSTWYDSLQTKATKRYSHGLDFTAAFTWQKELNEGAQDGLAASVPVNDVFNRKLQKYISGSSQPFTFVTAFTYRIPAWERSRVLKGWTIAGMLRYASGLPIEVPLAQNQLSSLLFRGTLANRVAGQPLFLKDLNCHCIDPNKDFVLNPKAWSDPAPGQWGTSAAFYNDYRYARRPNEQLSLSRSFRLREGMSLTLRAEFFNVFNRTYLNNPDSTNALATQSTGAGGVPISGFGRIDAGSLYNPPRTGQLVARFRF